LAKAATLTDDFDDGSLNTGLWTAYSDTGTSLAETGGQLQLALRANGTGYVGVFSVAQYDLTGSHLLVECPDAGTGGSGRTASLEIDLDGSNSLKVLVDGTGIMAQTVIAGANTSFGITTYSAVNHRWWRIREDAGSVYFEVSPSAWPGTWTALYSRTNPFALTAVTLKLFAGTYSSVATPGVPKFDNFNLLPGQHLRCIAASTQGAWTDQADGTSQIAWSIDESEPGDDADYIQSPASPVNNVSEYWLSAGTEPFNTTNHVLSVRAQTDVAAGGPMALTYELRQGGTPLSVPATWTDTLTPAVQRFDRTLSSPQATGINNYSALTVRFSANQAPASAPTFVAAGTFVNTAVNAATLTPGLPSGWAAGDVHVLVAARKDNTAMTALSGWTQVPSLSVNNGSTARNEVWYRRAVAGDTAPVVTFGSGTVLRCAQIYGVRGCIATGSPFAQTAAPADNVTQSPFSTTTVQTGALTILEDNVFGLHTFTVSTGPTSCSQPAGGWTTFTVTRSGNNGIAQGYSRRTYGAAGSSGTPISTLNTGGLGTAVLMLFRGPAAAPAKARITWAGLTVPNPPVVRNLTGGSGGAGSASGTVSIRVYKNLTGATAGTASPSALLTTRRRLTGGATGQGTVAVTLGRIPRPVRELTGAAQGRGQIGTAFLWGGGGLYGEASGSVWGATGVTVITGGPLPPGPKNLIGYAAGGAFVGADLTKGTSYRALVGEAAGASATTATPTRRRPLVAASAGRATIAGPLTARRRLVAAAAGTTTAAGFVDIAGSIFRPIFGTAAGRTTIAGVATARRRLVAATAGTATVTAVPSRRRPLASAAVLGRATTTAVIQRKKALAGASALGRATVAGAVTKLPQLPLTSVIWVVDHFEMGRVGTHVLWGDDQFRLTEPGGQVIWEEETFKVYVP
jgi:hypothetical protein